MPTITDNRPPARTPRRLTPVAAFGENPGALRMLTYRPTTVAAAAPMVVLLHGCGQSAEALANGGGWMELADRYGFVLLCPEQTKANNSGRCFNWFRPTDIGRVGGEAASIRQMAEHLLAEGGLDRGRVFVTGLSAGAAMALAMLATAPEMFAAGAVIAGMPYGMANGVGEALLAMRAGSRHPPARLGDQVRRASGFPGPWPRLSVWQGLADTTVAPANAGQIVAQWLDVWGLAPAPSQMERRSGQSVTVWRDGASRTVVELHMVDALAHGAPIAAQGPRGCGRPGPFLIETGISSSREILAFWGLEEARAARREGPVRGSRLSVLAAKAFAALGLAR